MADRTTASTRAAALLALAPLSFAASDLQAGMVLAGGTAATLVLLQLTASLTRAESASGFSIGLWATVAAAISSWIVAAVDTPSPAVMAVLPLAAANAAWWRQPVASERLAAAGLPLVCAPLAVGALRSGADASVYGGAISLPAWLLSPCGLLVLAALAAALHQALYRRPASPPAQDPPTA